MSGTEVTVVAVDGPSASGKSTVSKAAAKELGFFYVDSGAMYRGVTWNALRNGIDSKDSAAVVDAMNAADWQFRVEEGASVFSVDGITPVDELRNKPVREAVSDVAAVPAVREFVVRQLRGLRGLGSLVMEGRDIGTVVFPETPYKFYLDADPEERALRRYRELKAKGETEKAEEVMESLRKRDEKDAKRETAPLQVAPDACVINSTSLSIEEVTAVILKAVKDGKA